MDTTKRSPLDRLLFATFLKGRTSSRDIWEEKGDMTPEDNKKIIEETNETVSYTHLSGHTGRSALPVQRRSAARWLGWLRRTRHRLSGSCGGPD